MVKSKQNESFDVRSVMDILYGEKSKSSGGFIRGTDGKKAIQECEIIRNDNNNGYTSFWRKKPENTKGN